jgi:hypothetical protein
VGKSNFGGSSFDFDAEHRMPRVSAELHFAIVSAELHFAILNL